MSSPTKTRTALHTIILVVAIALLTSCGGNESRILGTWIEADGNDVYTFKKDSDIYWNNSNDASAFCDGKYDIVETQISFEFPGDCSWWITSYVADFQLSDDTLILDRDAYRRQK